MQTSVQALLTQSEVLFCKCVQHRLLFSMNLLNRVKSSLHSTLFSFSERRKSQGASTLDVEQRSYCLSPKTVIMVQFLRHFSECPPSPALGHHNRILHKLSGLELLFIDNPIKIEEKNRSV